jgi:type IV secretion system protein TrbL
VVASGVKVMVLAIIIGIGSTIFGELATTLTRPIDVASAMSLLLAALSLLGLGVFGPGIAAGLVSGAPQLGAGAAAGTVAGAAALTYAGGALALGGLRAVAGGSAGALRSAASLAGGSSSGMGSMRAAESSGVGSAGSRMAPAGEATGHASTAASAAPQWATRLRREQHIREAGHVAAHTLREGDKGGHSSGPKLREG